MSPIDEAWHENLVYVQIVHREFMKIYILKILIISFNNETQIQQTY